MNNYKELNFLHFPRVCGIIKIPLHTIIYITDNNKPRLGELPKFFTDHINSAIYKKKKEGYNIFTCSTNKINLMDIRSLKYLFVEYIGYNGIDFNKIDLILIEKTRFALGLMNIKDQYNFIINNIEKYPKLQLFKDTFPFFNSLKKSINLNKINKLDPILMSHYLQFGHRCSEESIDNEVAIFLKNIFGNKIDGYISPHVESIWHNYNFHQEICLFTPKLLLNKCTKQVLSEIKEITILEIMNEQQLILPILSSIENNYIKEGGEGEEINSPKEIKINTTTLLDEYKKVISNNRINNSNPSEFDKMIQLF